jgi:hypothetical protein
MKKIILKKKPAVIPDAPIEIKYIPAIEMEEGVQYVNPLCSVVLTMKSVKPYDGVLRGIEALRETVVVCDGTSAMGDSHTTVMMFGTQPVIADQPALVEKIIKLNQGLLKHVTAVRGERAATKPQRTDAEGKPITKAPRGDVDARTGCSKGSQGYVLGTIMLDNKCGPATREKCVALMTEKLSKEFGFTDLKKAKALAQSWYSTLWTRKPQIYQAGR